MHPISEFQARSNVKRLHVRTGEIQHYGDPQTATCTLKPAARASPAVVTACVLCSGRGVCVCVCVCVQASVCRGKRQREREIDRTQGSPAGQGLTTNTITRGSKPPLCNHRKDSTEVGCGLAVARIRFMERGKRKRQE